MSGWRKSGNHEKRLSNCTRVFRHFIILNELHKWTSFSDFLSVAPASHQHATSKFTKLFKTEKKKLFIFSFRSFCHDFAWRRQSSVFFECCFVVCCSSMSTSRVEFCFVYQKKSIKVRKTRKYSMFFIFFSQRDNLAFARLDVLWTYAVVLFLISNFLILLIIMKMNSEWVRRPNEGRRRKNCGKSQHFKSTFLCCCSQHSIALWKKPLLDTPDGMIEIS